MPKWVDRKTPYRGNIKCGQTNPGNHACHTFYSSGCQCGGSSTKNVFTGNGGDTHKTGGRIYRHFHENRSYKFTGKNVDPAGVNVSTFMSKPILSLDASTSEEETRKRMVEKISGSTL